MLSMLIAFCDCQCTALDLLKETSFRIEINLTGKLKLLHGAKHGSDCCVDVSCGFRIEQGLLFDMYSETLGAVFGVGLANSSVFSNACLQDSVFVRIAAILRT